MVTVSSDSYIVKGQFTAVGGDDARYYPTEIYVYRASNNELITHITSSEGNIYDWYCLVENPEPETP